MIIALFLGLNTYPQDTFRHQVFFNTNSSLIAPAELTRLHVLLDTIRTDRVLRIAIHGFCDDRGKDDYNKNLSDARALAVHSFLVHQTIPDSLIAETVGKGALLLPDESYVNPAEARRLNRKVEVWLTLLNEGTEAPAALDVEPITSEAQLKAELAVGDKILLGDILFKTGYSQVLEESKPTLERIAKVLKEREELYFRIQGHVCCTKNTRDAVNMETNKRNLSVARAKYIYDYFASYGIDKKRMKYVGMRRKFPLGGDPKFDRRVEVVVTYINPKASD